MGVIRAVIGLGNPGERYERTRHNVGFRVVEHLAGAQDWKQFQKGLGRFARRGPLFLAEPLTYMNEAGRFAQAFAAFYKIAPEDILIISDDIALDFGRLRLRLEGSAGGQKGMQSVIDCLGTQGIPRLRVGIGPQPAGVDSADFVLRRFSSAEARGLAEVIEQAGAAALTAVEDGVDAAMNRFNAASP